MHLLGVLVWTSTCNSTKMPGRWYSHLLVLSSTFTEQIIVIMVIVVLILKQYGGSGIIKEEEGRDKVVGKRSCNKTFSIFRVM